MNPLSKLAKLAAQGRNVARLRGATLESPSITDTPEGLLSLRDPRIAELLGESFLEKARDVPDFFQFGAGSPGLKGGLQALGDKYGVTIHKHNPGSYSVYPGQDLNVRPMNMFRESSQKIEDEVPGVRALHATRDEPEYYWVINADDLERGGSGKGAYQALYDIVRDTEYPNISTYLKEVNVVRRPGAIFSHALRHGEAPSYIVPYNYSLGDLETNMAEFLSMPSTEQLGYMALQQQMNVRKALRKANFFRAKYGDNLPPLELPVAGSPLESFQSLAKSEIPMYTGITISESDPRTVALHHLGPGESMLRQASEVERLLRGDPDPSESFFSRMGWAGGGRVA